MFKKVINRFQKTLRDKQTNSREIITRKKFESLGGLAANSICPPIRLSVRPSFLALVEV
jgi:hypothetical protein